MSNPRTLITSIFAHGHSLQQNVTEAASITFLEISVYQTNENNYGY